MNKNSLGLLILRVVAGGFMMTHGLQKLENFSEMQNQFVDLFGIGMPANLALVIGAELFCALLILLGVATRLAAVPLFVTMCVAGFMIHANDPFQKKELALLYAGVFAALFFLGTGQYGLGRKLFRNQWLH